MKIKVLGFMEKVVNAGTENEEKYTTVLCEFNEDTAKWVKVPDYVCPFESIKVGIIADVKFPDAKQQKATVFIPVNAGAPANVDDSTGEILDE